VAVSQITVSNIQTKSPDKSSKALDYSQKAALFPFGQGAAGQGEFP
jgi:hypothetical protein